MPKIMGRSALGPSPRVTSQRSVSTYQPIVAPAGGLGDAAEQVAMVADDILSKMAAERDEAALADAKTEYSRRKLALLDGDGEAETGFRNIQGQNALDGFKGYQGKLFQVRKTMRGGLKGNIATKFDAWAANEEVNAEGVMTRHLADQHRGVLDQSDTAYIGQMQREIVANPLDDKLVKQRSMEVVQRALSMADRKGIADQASREALALNALTQAHTGAIEALIAADRVGDAFAYFDKHRKQIAPLQAVEIEKKVRNHGMAKEAQTAADEAVSRFGNVDDALAFIRGKFEGKAEEAAVAEVKERYGEQEDALARRDRAKARAERDALDQGQQVADAVTAEAETETEALARVAEAATGQVRRQAEGIVRAFFAAKDRDDVDRNKDLRASAERKAREETEAVNSKSGLWDRLQKVRENAAAGLPQVSDENARQELYSIYREDKVRFAELDLFGERYGGKLNRADQDRLLGLQLAIDKDKVRADAAAAKAATKAQRLDRAYKAAEPYLKDAGFVVSGAKQNTAAFLTRLADVVDALPDDAQPTEKQLQEIALGLVLRGEIQGSGILDEDDAFAFEAGADFTAEDFADENAATIKTLSERAGVAPDRTALIVEALIRKGRPTTAAEIKAIDDKLRARGQ